MDNNINQMCKSSAYISLIVTAIAESKEHFLCHSELSEVLGISKSNLSNIIGRLVDSNLFQIEIEGRNKYYSLSNVGQLFYESLKQKENSFYYQRAKHQLRLNKNRK